MSPGQVTILTYDFGKTVKNPIIGFYGVDFAKEEWFDLNDNPVQLRILDASAPTIVTNNILTLSTSPIAGANTAATSAMGRVQVYGNVTGLKVKHTWLLTVANCDNHGFSFIEPTDCLGGPLPDIDGDGIPNSLDLDSDGDGCPDARESGVSGTLNSGAVKNGSNGAVTSTTTIVNAIASGPYGSNGLANGVETIADTGIVNYTSKYTPFALSKFQSICADTDGDGIVDLIDIDDDNDGILDATEMPTCFMSANDWNANNKTFQVNITSELNTLAPNSNFSALADNVGTVAALQFSTATAQAQLNKELFKVSFIKPIKLDALYIQKTSATQIFAATAASIKLQGSNDNATWTDLTVAMASPLNATNITANGSISLTNSNKFLITSNAGNYKYYRIYGVAAANILAGIASEFYFDVNTATYVASMFPNDFCGIDTDGDGILNSLDLDSDNDGCSDANEGNATSNTTSNFKFTGTMGANGLDNSLETIAESGFVNYTTTYNTYATENGINSCTDTDGDGVRNIFDLDDDNDGVLDIDEQYCLTVASPLDYYGPTYWRAISWANGYVKRQNGGNIIPESFIDGNLAAGIAVFSPCSPCAPTPAPILTDDFTANPITFTLLTKQPLNADGFSIVNDYGTLGDGIKVADIKLYSGNILLGTESFTNIASTGNSQRYPFTKVYRGISKVEIIVYQGTAGGGQSDNGMQMSEFGLYTARD